jgi:hypothetical protein
MDDRSSFPLYAEFRVVARSPLNGGVVRSWTLAHASATASCRSRIAAGEVRRVATDFFVSRTNQLAASAAAALPAPSSRR